MISLIFIDRISFASVFVGRIVFVFVLPSGSINYQLVICEGSGHNIVVSDDDDNQMMHR